MKITKVEVFDCEVNRIDPTMAKFNPILCRVHTDEGITGVGEAGVAYGAGAKAAVGMIRDLAPHVIGMDPMNVEQIWEKLFRTTFWGMSGGIIFYSGMAAIDIACWDIRGKALNAPVWQLLGGKTNDNLRTYASQLQFGWDDKYHAYTDPKDYAFAAQQALDDGYDAIKVDPIMFDRNGRSLVADGVGGSYFGIMRHDEIKMGRARLEAMRKVVGPDVDIILEIHSFFSTHAAIQFARAVEDLGIYYYEEPVHPMHTDNFAKVTDRVNMPVATGERSYTRWGYRPLLEKKALAVIQPDLCNVGGITEGKKVCDLAALYDATVQVHVCGGPVSTAASLHMEAVIPNFIIHEHHTYALKKCIIDLCTNNYQPKGGKYRVPDAPGLGQELNEGVTGQFLAHTIQ